MAVSQEQPFRALIWEAYVNMRVLLINSNLRDDLFAAPPIGVCYVASATESAGHMVQVLDLCFSRCLEKALEQSVRDFCPEIVGISVRNMDNANLLFPISYLPDALRVVNTVRRLTTAPIVVGGSGASLDPAGVLRLLHADFIVVSDGEQAFVELLDAIDKGKTGVGIPGVGTLANGEFVFTPQKSLDFGGCRPNLGKWINMRPYEKMGVSYNIQTKRGCNRRCIYCTYNQVIEGNRVRLRRSSRCCRRDRGDSICPPGKEL